MYIVDVQLLLLRISLCIGFWFPSAVKNYLLCW